MCGIAGTVSAKTEDALAGMLSRLAHRGPDDSGVYHDAARDLYLGHRRLSIIDLSPAGHQPMMSPDSRLAISFNGEIYNYKALAQELKQRGCRFHSTSDTEVVLHGYAEFGTDIFNKIDGMWAIALYDAPKGVLCLSRDPAGMKPLYFYQNGIHILFASEIGALAEMLSQETGEIDRGALANYLSHGYIPGEATIFKNIRALSPGATIMIDLNDGKTIGSFAYNSKEVPQLASLSQAVQEFDQRFAKSVRATLQADVPVGIFLSGGIDSALVAYHAHRSGARLQAFTIGFHENGFDESETASRIAAHVGFPHLVHHMSVSDIIRDIDAIFDSFGQPFADTSSLPTFYLSRLAHEHGYKVVLAGDGADELFGGYPTHYLPKLARAYQHAPAFMDELLSSAATLFPTRFTALSMKEKLARFLAGARLPYQEAHATWKRIFTDSELRELITDPSLLSEDTSFARYFAAIRGDNATDAVMQADFMTFLTSDCLVKSDICAMQSSVEVRAPFLNKEIIGFARSLPSTMKADVFRTKILLRSALARIVPPDIARLPKRGFVPPLAHWLTTDLKDIMLEMLSPEAIANIGFVNYTYVSRLVEEHLTGTHDHTKKLWSLMSLSRFFAKHHS